MKSRRPRRTRRKRPHEQYRLLEATTVEAELLTKVFLLKATVAIFSIVAFASLLPNLRDDFSCGLLSLAYCAWGSEFDEPGRPELVVSFRLFTALWHTHGFERDANVANVANASLRIICAMSGCCFGGSDRLLKRTPKQLQEPRSSSYQRQMRSG